MEHLWVFHYNVLSTLFLIYVFELLRKTRHNCVAVTALTNECVVQHYVIYFGGYHKQDWSTLTSFDKSTHWTGWLSSCQAWQLRLEFISNGWWHQVA